MHVPLAEQQHELLGGEVRIDVRQGSHLKRQVPRGEPGELPLVGHGQDVPREHVRPVGVSTGLPLVGRGRLAGVAVEPGVQGVVVELSRPQQAGVRLAGHASGFVVEVLRDQVGVERVGLGDAPVEDLIETLVEGLPIRAIGGVEQPKLQHRLLAGRQREMVMQGRLRAASVGVDGVGASGDHVIADGILDVLRAVGLAEAVAKFATMRKLARRMFVPVSLILPAAAVVENVGRSEPCPRPTTRTPDAVMSKAAARFSAWPGIKITMSPLLSVQSERA